MYLDGWGSSGYQGDVAKLRSPTFPMSGYNCVLQMAYHMRGSYVGSLAVRVQAEGGSQVVFNRTGEQPDGWQRVNITIGALSNFNVTLWGEVASSWTSDAVAVDDMKFVNCAPGPWEYVRITDAPVSLLVTMVTLLPR